MMRTKAIVVLLSLMVLLASCSRAHASLYAVQQASTTRPLQFSINLAADRSSPATGMLTGGATITATGGTTSTITSAASATVGQQLAVLTSANGNTVGTTTWITAVSGAGPYTLTISPALANAAANTDTFSSSQVAILIGKNGAAFAPPVAACAEVGNGTYTLSANATDDATLGVLWLKVIPVTSTPDYTDALYDVVAYNPNDGAHLGLSALPNVAAGAAGGLPTATNSSGQVVASNTLQLGGVTPLFDASNFLKIDLEDWKGSAASAFPANFAALLISSGGDVQLDLTQSLNTANTGDTVGGALIGARSEAFGKWVVTGNQLTLYAADGTTLLRTFTVSPTPFAGSRQ